MTLPAGLQGQLADGETLLWEAKPNAPKKLSAYRGWHEWVARIFFAVSAFMTLLMWLNQSEGGAAGLNWRIILFVGTPLLIGLAVRFGGGWLARKAMRNLHYAVTTQRILIQTIARPMSFTIKPDTPAEIIAGRKNEDVLRFTDSDQFRYVDESDIDRAVYAAPSGMVLPREEAAKALAAIESVKAQT